MWLNLLSHLQVMIPVSGSCLALLAGGAGHERDVDALGRLGGDEFVVVAEELSLAAGPELVAERLLEALRHPFKLGENAETHLRVTASIGVAGGGRASPEELLRDALFTLK